MGQMIQLSSAVEKQLRSQSEALPEGWRSALVLQSQTFVVEKLNFTLQLIDYSSLTP